MAEHLSNHHRETLAEIFDHQRGGNVEWRKVHSLLETVGTVTEEHNGKLKVTLGPETEVFSPPEGKDLERQTIVDLRRMLTQAGYAPSSAGGRQRARPQLRRLALGQAHLTRSRARAGRVDPWHPRTSRRCAVNAS